MLVGTRSLVKCPLTGGWITTSESVADNKVKSVPMPRAKAGTAVKPEPKPKPEPTSVHNPITEDGWVIVGVDIVRGFKIDPPKIGRNGKPMTYGRFAIPMITIEIRRPHWDAGLTLTIKRNTKGVISCLDEFRKPVKPLAGPMSRTSLNRIFGPNMGDTLAQILDI